MKSFFKQNFVDTVQKQNSSNQTNVIDVLIVPYCTYEVHIKYINLRNQNRYPTVCGEKKSKIENIVCQS